MLALPVIRRRIRVLLTLALLFCGLAPGARAAAARPWPGDVPGHMPPAAGEHPRLLFRRADVPALRARAQTPGGRAILDRLRRTLDGADGRSGPVAFHPEVGPVNSDGAGRFHATAPLGTYTFSHAAGYGLLYQVTGDTGYAELAWQCIERALDGYRDRDRRYAFHAPYGALRAGPVLGWTAIAYDLCHDGWDESRRERLRSALASYAGDPKGSLEELTTGSMPPFSNHFGLQVGGAALALLALRGEPGIDTERIERLLAASERSMVRNLTEGFGDRGFYAEGDGPGSMASHIIFLTALQAWRIAAGRDFVTPRPNASWTALKWIFLTLPRAGEMDFWPRRGAYPHNVWARSDKSGAGYFSIAFGALPPEQNAALLWFYEHSGLAARDAAGGTPFDTISVYPHLSVCAFVNWPFGLRARNPAEVLPRAIRDSKWSFFAFRNRWRDEDDIILSVQTKDARGYHLAPTDARLHVAALGKKFQWVRLPGDVTHWRPGKDGSAVLSVADGTSVAIDFSGASGVEGLLATTGAAEGVAVDLGGTRVTLRFLTRKPPPAVTVRHGMIEIGRQSIGLDQGHLVLATLPATPTSTPAPMIRRPD